MNLTKWNTKTKNLIQANLNRDTSQKKTGKWPKCMWKKKLDIITYQRNVSQYHNDISSYSVWMVIIKKTKTCYWKCKENEILICYCWEYGLGQPLSQMMPQFSKTKNRTAIYTHNPQLGIYQKEMKSLLKRYLRS